LLNHFKNIKDKTNIALESGLKVWINICSMVNKTIIKRNQDLVKCLRFNLLKKKKPFSLILSIVIMLDGKRNALKNQKS